MGREAGSPFANALLLNELIGGSHFDDPFRLTRQRALYHPLSPVEMQLLILLRPLTIHPNLVLRERRRGEVPW